MNIKRRVKDNKLLQHKNAKRHSFVTLLFEKLVISLLIHNLGVELRKYKM
jgi:hypothetical protein